MCASAYALKMQILPYVQLSCRFCLLAEFKILGKHYLHWSGLVLYAHTHICKYTKLRDFTRSLESSYRKEGHGRWAGVFLRFTVFFLRHKKSINHCPCVIFVAHNHTQALYYYILDRIGPNTPNFRVLIESILTARSKNIRHWIMTTQKFRYFQNDYIVYAICKYFVQYRGIIFMERILKIIENL